MPNTKNDLSQLVQALKFAAVEMEVLPMFQQPAAARDVLAGIINCLGEISRRLDSLTPYLDEEGAK